MQSHFSTHAQRTGTSSGMCSSSSSLWCEAAWATALPAIPKAATAAKTLQTKAAHPSQQEAQVQSLNTHLELIPDERGDAMWHPGAWGTATGAAAAAAAAGTRRAAVRTAETHDSILVNRYYSALKSSNKHQVQSAHGHQQVGPAVFQLCCLTPLFSRCGNSTGFKAFVITSGRQPSSSDATTNIRRRGTLREAGLQLCSHLPLLSPQLLMRKPSMATHECNAIIMHQAKPSINCNCTLQAARCRAASLIVRGG